MKGESVDGIERHGHATCRHPPAFCLELGVKSHVSSNFDFAFSKNVNKDSLKVVLKKREVVVFLSH